MDFLRAAPSPGRRRAAPGRLVAAKGFDDVGTNVDRTCHARLKHLWKSASVPSDMKRLATERRIRLRFLLNILVVADDPNETLYIDPVARLKVGDFDFRLIHEVDET